ncbi:hypothetical protein BJ508DRAFT_364905 [Ascobolus immersus RN42]|uniref:Uncharacterized protein n=1 Tax=Ascobolus immersus RN42 TaxID=1160509 RepID=A0A3N4HUI4_ASCIM|nr:hypothetical protein BJ508DRAFT_364905 [Ascobolus immersus RN42]
MQFLATSLTGECEHRFPKRIPAPLTHTLATLFVSTVLARTLQPYFTVDEAPRCYPNLQIPSEPELRFEPANPVNCFNAIGWIKEHYGKVGPGSCWRDPNEFRKGPFVVVAQLQDCAIAIRNLGSGTPQCTDGRLVAQAADEVLRTCAPSKYIFAMGAKRFHAAENMDDFELVIGRSSFYSDAPGRIGMLSEDESWFEGHDEKDEGKDRWVL